MRNRFLLKSCILFFCFCLNAVAQDTFLYSSNEEPYIQADSFAEAYASLYTVPRSSARFRLKKITVSRWSGIYYDYETGPFLYAYWNDRHWNGLNYAQPNVPGYSIDEAISNVIALQAKTAERYSDGYIPVFEQVVVTGKLHEDGWSGPWKYTVPVNGYVKPNRIEPDQIRAKYGTARIIRYLVPKCDCGNSTVFGNPINSTYGVKFQNEEDYVHSRSLLKFTRYYNSQFPATPSGMGIGGSWQNNFDRRLFFSSGTNEVTAFRADFDMPLFVSSGVDAWVGVSGNSLTLSLAAAEDIKDGERYKLLDSVSNTYEFYDKDGLLLKMKNQNDELSLTYSTVGSGSNYPSSAPKCSSQASSSISGKILCVTSKSGYQLNFAYDADGRLVDMYDPNNMRYTYDYDPHENISSIKFPNGFQRKYHYNEQEYTSGKNLPSALTGTSEGYDTDLMSRFGVYRYGANGLAIGTAHADGANSFTVTYDNGSGIRRSVVTPLGGTIAFEFQKINAELFPTTEIRSLPNGSSATATSTYDSSGNRLTYKDFNGSLTKFTYLTNRKLELTRVEAHGTTEARTNTTEWHPVFRLPLRIAEPKRIISYTYDLNGNVLSVAEQATSDANGALGFNAKASGTPRVRTYTYDSSGNLLTITGPCADIKDVTGYTYDNRGNLTSVTNAAGFITALSNYDENGRVGKITDPNGLVTTIEYSPRGWMTSMTTGGLTTMYDYDGVGKIKKVVFPNNSTINYVYDSARRLTDIYDSEGNSIHYTLDVMGNRISEQVRDKAGMLARQIIRSYDSLNRIEKITGALQ